MKFLIDQNLPVRLIQVIAEFGHPVEHIKLMGLAQADDLEIWNLAASLQAVVVSKDKDFLVLARRTSGNPGVVHLSLGNCSNEELHAIVRRDRDMAITRLMNSETVVELRP